MTTPERDETARTSTFGDFSRLLPRSNVASYLAGAVPMLVGLPLVALWASRQVDTWLWPGRQLPTPVWLAGLVLLGVGLVLWLYAPTLLVLRGKGIPLEGYDGPVFEGTRKLVVSGPYRYIRNPMYTGYLSLIAALGIVGSSHFMLFAVFPVWCWWTRRFVIQREEVALAARFGEPYLDYCRRVPRFLPGTPASGAVVK